MSVADIATIVTAVATATIALTGFLFPAGRKFYFNSRGTWPVGYSINSVKWNRRSTPNRPGGELDGQVRIELTLWPRKGTSKSGGSPSILTSHIDVDGTEISGDVGGRVIDRKNKSFSVNFRLHAEAFESHGFPSDFKMFLHVEYAPHDDRFLEITVNRARLTKDSTLVVRS